MGGWEAHRILVSAPVPLVLIEFLNWVGPRGFGDKVLGTGLDKNAVYLRFLNGASIVFLTNKYNKKYQCLTDVILAWWRCDTIFYRDKLWSQNIAMHILQSHHTIRVEGRSLSDHNKHKKWFHPTSGSSHQILRTLHHWLFSGSQINACK